MEGSMSPILRVKRKLSKKLSSSKNKAEKKVEKISKPQRLDQYTAVADYAPQETGEMGLTAGMVVEVTEKSESGE
jgi:hypothetical protein